MPGFGDLDVVRITGKYVMADGTATGVPATGTVSFETSLALRAVLDPTSDLIIIPKLVAVPLDVNGSFEAYLPATNDPDVFPTGWTYHVTETIAGGIGTPRQYDIQVPYNSVGQTLDLADIQPVAVLPDVSGYVLVTDFNSLKNRVHILELGGGPGTGGGGGPITINGVTDVDFTITAGDVGADVTGAAAAAQTASQPRQPNLTTLAAQPAPAAFGLGFLPLVDAAAAIAKLGLGTASLHDLTDFDLAGVGAAAAGARVARAGDTMAGPLALNADPVSALQAATKQYVDAHAAGFTVHPAVRLKTTANVNLATGLANGQTVDGKTIATGDRILAASQTAGAENGVYIAPATGSASRAADADTGTELDKGAYFLVTDGDTQQGAWSQQIATPTLGTTALVFGQVSGPTSVSAGAGIAVAGNLVSLADGGVTDAKVATANKDGLAGVPSLRTLGAGALQAVAGTDARLTDARTPLAHAPAHAAGGGDPLTLTTAQITGLVAALAALAPIDNPTFTGVPIFPALKVSGLPGAVAAGRFVGVTLGGPPTSGLFRAGDFVFAYTTPTTGAPVGAARSFVCTQGDGTTLGVWAEMEAAQNGFLLQATANTINARIDALPEIGVGEGILLQTASGTTTLTNNHPIRFVRIPTGVNNKLVANGVPGGAIFITEPTLQLHVDANTTYQVEAFLDIIANTAADWKMKWSVPAGGTMLWTPRGPHNSVTTNSGILNLQGAFETTTVVMGGGDTAGNATSLCATPVGWLNTVSAGTLIIQLGQSVAHASDLIVLGGSWLKVTRLA